VYPEIDGDGTRTRRRNPDDAAMLPDTAGRSPSGALSVGGCDLLELAARHGTPLYVFDEATIRTRLRAYREALRAWPPGGDVLYSAKAFLSPAMVRILVEEDCGADVVSGGELEIVLRGGLAASRIAFPGNNKSPAEVESALAAGIGHLVVDSDHELDLLAGHGGGRRIGALLRVTPGVRPDTHDHISTGQVDSKFGFDIAGGQAMAALRRAIGVEAIEVRGLHMHIGSQILELRSHAAAVDAVAEFAVAAREELGFTLRTLSAGGGLGIAHTAAEHPPSIATFMSTLTESIERGFGSRGLPPPALHVEPGRSVVGPAAVALYTVGARKAIPGVRTYVSVDGGMADNIRPELYGARYQPVLVRDPDAAAVETVTVAGRYCESTDVLVRDCALPELRAGDILAVPAAGAYTLSMASNYNAGLRPAVVFVHDGIARLVRRRETVDDLLRCELTGTRVSAPD
jgi:diaminopimelate decarboxylase